MHCLKCGYDFDETIEYYDMYVGGKLVCPKCRAVFNLFYKLDEWGNFTEEFVLRFL